MSFFQRATSRMATRIRCQMHRAFPSLIPAILVSVFPIGYPCTTHALSLVEEGFNDFQSGRRPDGWTFTNCNSNSDTYVSAGYYGVCSPAIKLDKPGDAVLTPPLSGPLSLAFWFRGNYNTSTSGNLLV